MVEASMEKSGGKESVCVCVLGGGLVIIEKCRGIYSSGPDAVTQRLCLSL